MLRRPPSVRSLLSRRLPVGILALGLLAVPVSAEEVVDLSRFGKAGDLRPTVGESFIDEGFYTQDMTAAAASRQYHTAAWSMPTRVDGPARVEKFDGGELRVSTSAQSLGRAQLGLVLSNPQAEGPQAELVDVTVSLRHAEGVRNYLVRLEGGETRGLTLPSATPELGRLETVLLLAFSPFSAEIQLETTPGSLRSESLDVMAPIVDSTAVARSGSEKVVNYCQNINSWIRISDSAGAYVIAMSKRFYKGTYEPTNWDIYYHNIEYPAGTLFHRGNGAGVGGVQPPCKSTQHNTTRTDYSKSHIWYGMDDLVIACQGTGVAICTSGCDATFTVDLASSSLGRCF